MCTMHERVTLTSVFACTFGLFSLTHGAFTGMFEVYFYKQGHRHCFINVLFIYQGLSALWFYVSFYYKSVDYRLYD